MGDVLIIMKCMNKNNAEKSLSLRIDITCTCSGVFIIKGYCYPGFSTFCDKMNGIYSIMSHDIIFQLFERTERAEDALRINVLIHFPTRYPKVVPFQEVRSIQEHLLHPLRLLRLHVQHLRHSSLELFQT